MQFSLSEFLSGSGVALLLQTGIDYWKKKREKRVDLSQNIADIANVHKIMERVTSETFFNRFMIFVGEDSAGILAAGKNLYVTAQYEKIHEEEGAEMQPILEDIQRWKADTFYYDLFSEMLSKGFVKIKTADMPECKLKSIYLMQGVKTSKWYHLMTTKDNSKVFYCSVASSIKDEANAEDRVKIDSSIDKLIEIFKRHKKFYK